MLSGVVGMIGTLTPPSPSPSQKREQEHQEELERQKVAKEKEVARLRAQQERAKDKQAERVGFGLPWQPVVLRAVMMSVDCCGYHSDCLCGSLYV